MCPLFPAKGFLDGSVVKNLPAMWETWVLSLGWEEAVFGIQRIIQGVRNTVAMQETWILSLGWKDLLEKRMATLCSILAWRIPWTEESGGL